MKTSLALILLAALSLNVEANLKNLKPHDIVMPVNPKHTYQEWLDIFAAQKPSPEYNPNYKKGTEPQPEIAGKVYVPVNEDHNRITGGNTASRAQFPWQVFIIIDGARYCGGSLISSLWVLTAAQCTGGTYQLTLGANRLDIPDDGSQVVLSGTSIVHSQYNSDTLDNDIAVILLPSEITFDISISPVKLPLSTLGNLEGETVVASGWGKTSDSASGLTPFLQYVQLTVISNQECSLTYGNVITPTKICTSTTGGKSTCLGDTGGPLVYLLGGVANQVGIVSFGAVAGCQLGYPVGFTRITSYLSWIQTNTGVSPQL